MIDFGWPQAIVLLVAVQRLGELALSARNMRRLIARGGVEVGAGHYPAMVAIHTGWLLALFFLVPADAPILWLPLAAFAVVQGFRVWVIATLGPYWTTRIVTLPGAPLVRSGPYRFLRHPNYVVVAAEILLLPLAFGAVAIAAVFTVLNAAILHTRIRAENAALAERRP
jgi:methyltransferase